MNKQVTDACSGPFLPPEVIYMILRELLSTCDGTCQDSMSILGIALLSRWHFHLVSNWASSAIRKPLAFHSSRHHRQPAFQYFANIWDVFAPSVTIKHVNHTGMVKCPMDLGYVTLASLYRRESIAPFRRAMTRKPYFEAAFSLRLMRMAEWTAPKC